MAHHSIRKGLDIPIAGAASGEPVVLPPPPTIGIDPRELRGMIPRLAAREGDTVAAGQPLFFHKFDQRVQVVAPVAGRVAEIRRGARRVITAFVLEPSGDAALPWKAYAPGELASLSREEALDGLLTRGLWTLLRTRPLDRLADPNVVPQDVLIGGMETGPLMPGPAALLRASDKEALQAAIHVLGRITDGAVHLTHAQGESHPAFQGLTGAQVHTFSGPHPAGDMAVQVSHVCPPRGRNRVLTVSAADAVAIGRTFLSGRVDAERVYAAVGAGVATPRFVRTLVGAPLAHVVGAVASGPQRWIRGSVLTGTKVEADTWAGWHTRGVHVLPDTVERTILGWALPSTGMWSFHRAFLKGWGKPSKAFDLRPGLYGGHRAIVPTGVHDDVIATPDVLPTFLFKSILSGDLENSIKLGMLDISEEEAALCAFICPSKIDYDVILREGLELYAKEA
ncbi:MAG: NADH:ubiquinone reductase (Na(+)-transporting) subunit A [Alphaproteobacteria bacterium]|nr:NADH:ubiquinone reductase (Na(+)-transporting) subunit A [Alphaproteobacteria bacterium]